MKPVREYPVTQRAIYVTWRHRIKLLFTGRMVVHLKRSVSEPGGVKLMGVGI